MIPEHTIYYTWDEEKGIAQMWCFTCSEHGPWRNNMNAAFIDATAHQARVLTGG